MINDNKMCFETLEGNTNVLVSGRAILEKDLEEVSFGSGLRSSQHTAMNINP
jgi:hypothetical protein